MIKRLNWQRRITVKIVPFSSDQFPHNLKQIYDPPLLLYIKGDIIKSDTLALAVVGARRCSYYGLTQAERFGRQLAQVGFCVVSGMARGIDTNAHTGGNQGKRQDDSRTG